MPTQIKDERKHAHVDPYRRSSLSPAAASPTRSCTKMAVWRCVALAGLDSTHVQKASPESKGCRACGQPHKGSTAFERAPAIGRMLRCKGRALDVFFPRSECWTASERTGVRAPACVHASGRACRALSARARKRGVVAWRVKGQRRASSAPHLVLLAAVREQAFERGAQPLPVPHDGRKRVARHRGVLPQHARQHAIALCPRAVRAHELHVGHAPAYFPPLLLSIWAPCIAFRWRLCPEASDRNVPCGGPSGSHSVARVLFVSEPVHVE